MHFVKPQNRHVKVYSLYNKIHLEEKHYMLSGGSPSLASKHMLENNQQKSIK